MKDLNVSYKVILKNPVYFLAFGFGSGLSKWFPGTCGTLVAIPLYLLIQPLSLINYTLVLLITFLIGIWLCDVTEKAIGIPDYSGIVWDEICGYGFTMFAAPKGWTWIIFGFFLFRIFDIWKPYPVSWIDQKIKGGLGIMLDDVMAAIYASVCMQLVALGLH